VSLIRGGAIYGRLLDQFGEPAAGTRLQAFRSRMVEGGRRLQSVGASDLADDNGAFRLYGLPPGNYVVMASPGAPGFNAFKRDPPIYYPGTPNLAEAQPVALGIGAEAAVDFNLVSTRYARVSGLVLNASGAPAAAARINLRQDAFGLGPDFAGGVAPILHAEGAPDGTFTVENVPPGNYTLSAVSFVELASPDRRAAITSPDGLSIVTSRVPESAAMPIVVSGDDLSGLTLAVRPGSMLIGRFETDTGVARPLPSGLQVSARAPNAGGNTTSILSFTRGEFRITTMAEPVRIQVAGLPDDWAVKAILVDGADVTDDTIELKDPTVDVRIVLTDRVTSISGRVEARQKTGGHRILVFADDAARWKWPSRYVRTTMADDEGRFLIRGLPPGERYNIAALEYFEEGDEQDPEFLHRLRRFATSVSLREGEQQTVQLKVAAR
jgi:hypothetical protein